MKKFYLLFCYLLLITVHHSFAQGTGVESRMKEVFQVTELTHGGSGNTRFYDPWEVTYGPDDSLWITEAKRYKVYKVSPNGGTPRMILNIDSGSTFFTSTADQAFRLQFVFSQGGGPKYETNTSTHATAYVGSPQGGLAGLAIHPDFMKTIGAKKYVYVSYIHKFDSLSSNVAISGNNRSIVGGVFYRNSLVRFTFNTTTGLLESPVMICDTLPGSSDHNSQRIIIAPVNGVYYLFYANGDMGAGQFGNAQRKENAQDSNSYEGKILRFNLESDGDADPYQAFIPNNNPYNTTLGKQSAVWAIGFRNNQGFAYARINNTDYLYGQMHGPFSDDEINVIQSAGNYGHPVVVGYASDGNYNGAAAGNPLQANGGGLPLITDELAKSLTLHNYHDPIYTFYPALQGSTTSPSTAATNTIQRMYYDFNHGNQSNQYWPSEAPSGLDVYTNSMIPGWKNSLISAVMKGAPGTGGGSNAAGRLNRLKLTANGSAIDTTHAHNTDTVAYFSSVNRFRDVAISPDGLSLFAIIDSSSTTSGPTATNPINSLCKGCLLKMTFLGYYDNGTTSTLPDTINIGTPSTLNTCVKVDSITIGSTNNSIWVPITDSNSNIIAEINAGGNNLGKVVASVYENSGTIRESANRAMYMDRNVTITPAVQPSSAVKVRLYVTNAEFNALKNATNSKGVPSGIASISSVGIFKNSDPCSNGIGSTPNSMATTTFTRSTSAGSNGYALQTSVTSFSTFYFAGNTVILALRLVSFTGQLVNNVSQLQWVTEEEKGTKNFVVERSTDGFNFNPIGSVNAKNTTDKTTYGFPDASVSKLNCTVVYYRLQIVDINGRISYSEIISIDLPGVAGNISIHPNPVINEATIDVTATVGENAIWQVVDNTGRPVMQKTILLNSGTNTFTINVGGLPVGVYYLTVTGNTIHQQIKFQKL